MKRLIKILLILLIVAAAGYKIYGRITHHGGAGGPGGMMGGPPPAVDIAAVIEKDVQLWSEFSGRLTAVDMAEVRPRVSGIIEEIHFANGARVSKGDLLFTIDPRSYQAALDAASATQMQAEAQEKLAQTEFERSEKLLKIKAIAQSDYDAKKSAVDVAGAALNVATAARALAQINMDYTQVTAPIAGRAGRAEITAGNLVESGFNNAPLLTTIVSDDRVYADFEMDEASFLRYYRGASQDSGSIPVMMGLSAEEGAPHQGKIESFDNSLNAASGTIRVRAVFDNPDGSLMPGLFARIRIGSPQESKVLLVDDRAIGTDQDKKFVLVIGPENKVEYRPVRPGALIEGMRVVEGSIAAGDRIIVNGLQRARPGMPVTPQEAGDKAQASPAAAGTP